MQSESENAARVPGFYVWEIQGKPVCIQLSLDVIDRLQQDVIRGFGAVPRRGAEVGGILLGSRTHAGPEVRIEDYELIPIEYKRGPSYLLSPEDVQAFAATFDQLAKASGSLIPVGYFRSHTRDAVGLGDEDLELLKKYFPEPEAIVLLIRPYGTKPSIAGFYFREDGEFQKGPPLLEFPLRRKDLAPNDSTPPRPAAQRAIRRPPPPPPPPPVHPGAQRSIPVEQRPHSSALTSLGLSEPQAGQDLPAAFPDLAPVSSSRRRSVWVPLSLVFLLLGLLLGFQAAITVRPEAPGAGAYHLSLSVTPSASDLQVKWDRNAPAIKAARRGVLVIEDGDLSKQVDLDPGQLQNGNVVVYRRYSNHVRFRLELSMTDTDTVIETAEWKQ